MPEPPARRYNLAAVNYGKKRQAMTYCCGILVREGLVMIADTRTNAGLDNVSTFRKLNVYTEPGERIMALASAGNLSLSQTVRSTLTEGVQNHETGEIETLLNAPTMFQAAQRIGRVVRSIQNAEGKALAAAEVDHDVAFLFGGQIKGGRLRLFMIYSAGNFIECTTDTPYLQIGEHKYGKPVLDRAISFDTDLYDALKMRADLHGLHHALQSRRRAANRYPGGAPGYLQRRAELPHRAGRALFPRLARALVKSAARRPYGDPAPALSQPGLNTSPARLPAPPMRTLLSYPFTFD